MKATKLWSSKGVALYPVDFPLVGQNAVFNGLFKFKQGFLGSQADDIAGFFVLIGDWGLGKTRIGYELFAQTFNHVERWVFNDEYVVPNGESGRILNPQLAEGILPLYIRYDMVCDDDLYADNWVARVSAAALRLVAKPTDKHDVPAALLEDLRAALKVRGIDMDALRKALGAADDATCLSTAMDILRDGGLKYLWIVVDEVETLADRKKGLPGDDHQSMDENYLDMVSVVIKHENYRQAHPYVNFLVLCSSGMRDKIEIGPNRRRTDVIELEPNRIGDVHAYVKHLRDRAEAMQQTVDYPKGTLEGAFIACNRNFGWFNVMMSSIHESYRQASRQKHDVTAWQLIEEFAQSEPRAQWIFDLSVRDLLRGAKGIPRDILNRLLFGQLPILLVGEALEEAQVEAARNVTIPGMGGPVFADLVEVHLDVSTLATELVRPEIGFKLSTQGGDRYLYYSSEISLGSLLAALRAFSVGAWEGNFVICRDLAAFTAQLSVLYDRPNVDILQIAEPLHGVFLKYQVTDRRYLGPSFALLQRMDILLKREAASVAFLQDSHKDTELDKYTQKIEKSDRKRQDAICQGFAYLLDDTPSELSSAKPVHCAANVTFNSTFQSPRFDGLRVTMDGRVTVVYGRDLEKLAQELGDWIGQVGVHPIMVLLPSGSTVDEWETARLPARIRLCTLARALTHVEETFLIKYSGRGTIFQASDILSAKSLGTRGMMQQKWQADTRAWCDGVEQSGYLLRPLWYSKSISETDFARGYRDMLVKGLNIDELAPDVNLEFDAQAYDNVRKACSYNAEPGPGQQILRIVSAEPYEPVIPPAFGTLLHELKSQAKPDALRRFFFFAPLEKKKDADVKLLVQILELLRALGLVTLNNSFYRAVDAQTLKGYREAASAWLNNECKAMLADLSDAFTNETVTKLQKHSNSFAPKDLGAAEQAAQHADWSVLDVGGGISPENLRALARQIAIVEGNLGKVCPPGTYRGTGEKFECITDRIATYEKRLNELPLWEHVNFLHWLREQYRQRREQLAHAIQQELAEAESLKIIDGCPFPIAPLTMPLKAILEEMVATLVSGGLSSRGAIPVPGFPQSVNTYIYMGQYANAWSRLEALGQYVERGQPTSFWVRFQAARSQWTSRLRDYQNATTIWDSLTRFMGEASSPAWSGAKPTRANLEQFRALVEGELERTINTEASHGVEKMIETLEEEVKTADKFRDLPAQITVLRKNVESELRALIDETRLHALTRVLTAKRRSQLQVPGLAATYTETKAAFEQFNVQIAQTGKSYFEGADKQIPWERWVEIYTALHEGRYSISPEDDIALRELEEMKLIERTVKLR